MIKLSTKEIILRSLQENKIVSGEQLGKLAGISRTAVWKHIKSLCRENYQIRSIPGNGYSLQSSPQRLTPSEIRTGLHTEIFGQQIYCYPEVTSTQDLARNAAYQGAEQGTVYLAEKQNTGRGRLNREWVTLPEAITMSVIIRPQIAPNQAAHYSIIAGVAIFQAIWKTTGLRSALKWPNDIFVNGKKAGGILAEMSAELDRVDFIILGLGLNVNCTLASLPPEIKDRTTSLKDNLGQPVPRVMLVQAILTELETCSKLYSKEGFQPLRELWKNNNITLGCRVKVDQGGTVLQGKAADIDEQGALILVLDTGQTKRINAGEVTLIKE